MKKLIDDCFLHDNRRMLHAEAVAALKERVRPVAGTESVPLELAAGRVIAAGVTAALPIPAHTNAAVDGYSFAFADYDPPTGTTLPVEGRAAAGHALASPARAATAARVFTGAVMPAGHDTVVMQEDVEVAGTAADPAVRIPPGLRQGANRRLAGEDVAAGERMMAPGVRLRPQDVAALAAAGRSMVECYRPLEVAIVSSGDEVVRTGTSAGLAPGQVFDANAPMLHGLVRTAGALPHDLGVWPDRADVIRERLAAAAARYQVIIASGGASLGEEDHMVRTLEALGRRHLWQLAIKPGRPMSFGQIGDAVFIGLPGNPVAVFVCFLMYVFPLLAQLGGRDWPEPRRFRLPAAFEVSKRKTGRREFWRGITRPGHGGGLAVDKFARDGSGLISGLRQADGLIEIGEDVTAVRTGDPVDFLPFSEWGIEGG